MAEWLLDIFVAGAPQTKGNLTGFRMGTRIKLTEKSGADQRLWAALVHDEAVKAWRAAGRAGPTTTAVSVRTDFVMPRRKSAPKRRTDPHIRKPDGDKITRSVWDAMTHVVYADDAQIVEWSGSKREAEIGETPGARIRVAAWDAGDRCPTCSGRRP